MTERPVPDGGDEHDRQRHSPVFMYDIGANELPSEAVVRAVSAVTNTPIVDLDPLYHVLDPEYLDGLFEQAPDRTVGIEGPVSFIYCGYEITVTCTEVDIRGSADDNEK